MQFAGDLLSGPSPGSALAFFEMVRESDVSGVVPAVRVPHELKGVPDDWRLHAVRAA